MLNKVFDSKTLVEHAEEHLGATVMVQGDVFIDISLVHAGGYMVALPGSENPMGRLYSGRIDKFVSLHPLLRGKTYLGLWYDDRLSENDRPWFIEESMWFGNTIHAMNYAEYWGQQYIWHIAGKNRLEVR